MKLISEIATVFADVVAAIAVQAAKERAKPTQSNP